MHRTMITGINGFVGQHMAREMHAAGCQVIGVGRGPIAPEIKPLVTNYYTGDLTQPDFVASLPLDNLTSLVNLAGMARMIDDSVDPELYTQVNAGVTQALAARAMAAGNKTLRFVAISSGQVYESTGQPPFNEHSDLIFPPNRNPYVRSKILMEEAMAALYEKGLDCVVARPFNHIGPGQKPGFLLPDLAQQISQAKDDHKSIIEVGDLSKKRDFSDVRDVVRAYRLLAFAGREQLGQLVYNICSGQPLTGRRILDLLIQNMSDKDMTVHVDSARLRPNDPDSLYGDFSAIEHDLGWNPTTPIEQTVADFAAWQKKQV